MLQGAPAHQAVLRKDSKWQRYYYFGIGPGLLLARDRETRQNARAVSPFSPRILHALATSIRGALDLTVGIERKFE